MINPNYVSFEKAITKANSIINDNQKDSYKFGRIFKFLNKKKIYLGHSDKNGWKVYQLGIIDQLFRKMNLAFKDTHREDVLKKLKNLPPQEANLIPPELKTRLHFIYDQSAQIDQSLIKKNPLETEKLEDRIPLKTPKKDEVKISIDSSAVKNNELKDVKNPAKTEIDMKEKNSATSVPISTPNLTVPIPIIVPTPKIKRPFAESPELIKMNQKLLALREQIENLTNQLSTAPFTALPSIRNEKKKLLDEHTELAQAKINFVKIHFPENPIYALAIPQTLKKGLQVSTAGKQAKMDNIKQNGIIFNPSIGATGLDPSVPRGLFGINEMGDRGIYFSTEKPAYLCDDYPIALGCELTTDLSGASITPISSLITLGFKEEEINRGFDQLQKEFNFLQHDGTYPSNTEIVFMKNDQLLKMHQEYYINNLGRVQVRPVIGLVHNSWQ